MDNGSEAEFGPGDVGSVPPGHDAWIVGDEVFISIDFPDCLKPGTSVSANAAVTNTQILLKIISIQVPTS
jgi:hypothetical protein